MSKIIIDIDNVVVDSISTLVNIHNYRHPENKYLNINKNCGWNFEGLLDRELTTEEVNGMINNFEDELFYEDNISVLEKDVVEVINDLSNKYDIIFCSRQSTNRSLRTINHFSKIFPNTYYLKAPDFNKSEMFDIFDNDILCVIDDRIDCLESFKGISKYLICYGDYKWNKEWNGERITNWKEIYKILESDK